MNATRPTIDKFLRRNIMYSDWKLKEINEEWNDGCLINKIEEVKARGIRPEMVWEIAKREREAMGATVTDEQEKLYRDLCK
jgi:hypothetical protein